MYLIKQYVAGSTAFGCTGKLVIHKGIYVNGFVYHLLHLKCIINLNGSFSLEKKNTSQKKYNVRTRYQESSQFLRYRIQNLDTLIDLIFDQSTGPI